VAPGNAGTAQIAQNLDISPGDIDSLLKIAKEKGIDLTVVGPEAPLAEGIVDRFQDSGMAIFGPTKKAAEIESSKVFARELMEKYNIPCAKGAVFSSYDEAKYYLRQQTAPIVVKADGLAAGKGVTVAESIPQALEALANIMEARAFGSAGDRVIIEECLVGREISFIAFSDGISVAPMVPACDYKRIYDGDVGPNTGGMGGYSPPYFYSPSLANEINETIIKPAVTAMASEGRVYRGVLYAGLMLTANGPKVLEFNARFGDPETQVVLPLLKTDLVDIILGVIGGNLDQVNIEWSKGACVGVVIASAGYPDGYQKGFPIYGLNDLDTDIIVFHAGTKLESGQVVTNGGRVLTVAATAGSLNEARKRVYANLPRIRFDGCHYRRDIAEIK